MKIEKEIEKRDKEINSSLIVSMVNKIKVCNYN